MPTRPDRSYRTSSQARFVWCTDCAKTWRYGCIECAELFADYHRENFPGHNVLMDLRDPLAKRVWRPDEVSRSTQNLMGRPRW
jgi:hypothetical protein